ncbi:MULTISPECIES: tRNA preQ1(34) S-adenosylmethionine ribosyltransferase-isomerase QueA [unclassified Okeania]|uniref:tRNA preQ1(34) S-adenosylmethionine ribosyltransferase-isomerase QueA n=1 Tax=unclassified Okeania TaxID=2634635 RepID=UPI0013B825CD|nr:MULTISPECIES: tRNA preQ1(34) S-adenosylmethionine ribosyltransferase-isomerase QueA [unclassified Okeania]NET12795.1 tRNA preQ1(34) S-adenosylmethionine ribosyltransferase-isomerase QueA [Okeania sp. SIO1H6]NES79682.1 tRNA preQ1(34) S-adenosylmethionine ribosyltransferase-isomerase QueA [Okeania sp. SIO1H4]NET23339.1 tRNA preQ1(34) S-adenosylmethionine ribosyltransferase-isomerase QueA [Okeania sp. SIO1H5]NET80375.1 tRNA preQ1(34) S-adenosylmethionine ribosyltransferase-isomerase QueA [Okean
MTEVDWSIDAYDYELPQELIAQNPVVPRDSSHLMVVDSLTHHNCIFRDLPDLLESGDLLVLNNTRVIPGRLYGHKTTGARVEILLLKPVENDCWLALVKPGKRFSNGTTIEFIPNSSNCNYKLQATVLSTERETGGRFLQFNLPQGISLINLLDQFGHVPFPPYVTDSQALTEQYQTVYGTILGAVAAPTAGLHFTDELLEKLEQKNIRLAFITLHVGLGTFRPVETEDITKHDMHYEWIEVSPSVVDKINQTKSQGGRIIAVGTTVVRALEGAALANQNNSNEQLSISPFSGYTNIFIYPGYKWQIVEGLITNFHLPRSSLLMLVSAMIGRKRLFSLYQEAIAKKYRFYSFGDAMFILPVARIN